MSNRVFIRKPISADIPTLLVLAQRSQDFHFPWVFATRTTDGWQDYIARCQQTDFEGLLICHGKSPSSSLENISESPIVGVANLSQIFYGPFQNAYLGYYADVDFAGQGLMTAGMRLVIDYAFDTLNLHRLEANIQPDNIASIKLVNRLGFSQEGFSRRYLKINGEWCDHQRWALTVEDWR
ncbi:MAG: GNAT family protein [Cyanobacteria bacterium P01_F01_bin.4]